MKSIKEKAMESYTGNVVFDYENRRGFEAGANYVLEQIENFMKGLDLGNSAKEKFYKLDILADIHGFIEQLKK